MTSITLRQFCCWVPVEIENRSQIEGTPDGSKSQRAVTSLASLSINQSAAITALRMHEREAAWLRAIGLGEGITVTVLRRAPLGGPLHVRVSGGAELAVDRELARHVDIEPAKAAP
jgi:ferrous iron transport protein A